MLRKDAQCWQAVTHVLPLPNPAAREVLQRFLSASSPVISRAHCLVSGAAAGVQGLAADAGEIWSLLERCCGALAPPANILQRPTGGALVCQAGKLR